MKLRILAIAILVLAPAAAQAGPRDDVINALVKCADLPDKMARADCFDAATPQLRAAAQAPVAENPIAPPAAPTETAAAPPSSDTAWMSALNPFSGGGPDVPTSRQMAFQPIGQEILPLTIGVSEYSVGGGMFTVTLDNGQVWRSRHADTVVPTFLGDKKNIVVIDHAMLGGYNLNLRNSATMYKVVRVK